MLIVVHCGESQCTKKLLLFAFFYSALLRHAQKRPQAVCWKIATLQTDEITGIWSGNGKELPIKLQRINIDSIDKKDTGQLCSQSAFLGPILMKPKFVESAAAIDGVAYTTVELNAGKNVAATLETFKLKGTGRAIQKINKVLLTRIDEPDYEDCIGNAVGSQGGGGEYSFDMKPIVLTKNWLVAQSFDGSFCGMAHPINEFNDYVFDLRSGKDVDISIWIKADETAKLQNSLWPLSTALTNIVVLKQTSENPECGDVVREKDLSWRMSLDHDGMIFTPQVSYSEKSCENPVTIGFKKYKII